MPAPVLCGNAFTLFFFFFFIQGTSYPPNGTAGEGHTPVLGGKTKERKAENT